MHGLDLIVTLTGGLVAALVGGYITQRLKLSPIVGYILAGLVVGPYTPGFVADRHVAEQLAEVGVILLMFGVGLQLHLEDLLAVKRVAIPGAIFQSLVATAIGAFVADRAGWGLSAGIVYGVALSVASTVVLVRVLSDNRQLHTPTGHIAVGWLVVEDLFTVLVLVLMPAIFAEAGGRTVPVAIGLALVKVVALGGLTLVVGGRVLPWVLTAVARTQSRELFTLAVLAIALGIAVSSAQVFGVSMALGAFLAGLVVGRSEFGVRATSDALPMRDAFAVLFFVSVGMLLDPGTLLDDPQMLAATLAVVLIGKPLAAVAIVLLFRYPLKVALSVAVALAQIGEFSFIVASVATDYGVLTADATNTLVAAAIISITLNPLLFRSIGWLDRWLTRGAPAEAQASPSTDRAPGFAHRAVVVGYGPVGRTVTRLLQDNDIEPTIVEMNLDTVREVRDAGLHAIYGDATHPSVLGEARIAEARAFIIAVSPLDGVEEACRLARAQNADIRILARATHVREARHLREAGADVVFSGEGEVALAFTTEILGDLGATPDQIDRERVRVRGELA
ncbi:MAG: cation:proton antiporter [Vicinamibacteria bacterium]